MKTNLKAVSLAAALLAACGVPTYGDGDNGKTISAQKGEVVQLALRETPSTPFRWEVKQEPSAQVVKVVSSDVIVRSNTPGASGDHVWRLEIVGAGKTTFELQLKSVGDGEVTETYAVTFDVK